MFRVVGVASHGRQAESCDVIAKPGDVVGLQFLGSNEQFHHRPADLEVQALADHAERRQVAFGWRRIRRQPLDWNLLRLIRLLSWLN